MQTRQYQGWPEWLETFGGDAWNARHPTELLEIVMGEEAESRMPRAVSQAGGTLAGLCPPVGRDRSGRLTRRTAAPPDSLVIFAGCPEGAMVLPVPVPVLALPGLLIEYAAALAAVAPAAEKRWSATCHMVLAALPDLLAGRGGIDMDKAAASLAGAVAWAHFERDAAHGRAVWDRMIEFIAVDIAPAVGVMVEPAGTGETFHAAAVMLPLYPFADPATATAKQ